MRADRCKVGNHVEHTFALLPVGIVFFVLRLRILARPRSLRVSWRGGRWIALRCGTLRSVTEIGLIANLDLRPSECGPDKRENHQNDTSDYRTRGHDSLRSRQPSTL